jgi:SAM-dependent methyltransferase
MSQLDDLHVSLIPILRLVFRQASLPRVGLALDLACGPGLKTPLLAEACGPGVRLLGVDIDRAAIRAATTDGRPPTTDQSQEPRTENQESRCESLTLTRSPVHPFTRSPSVVWAVGDALALPLVDGCCATAFCIAALSLFADRRVALRELRRVLAPGGVALLVVGVQCWAQTIRWPDDLATSLAMAYAQALADGSTPAPAAPDVSDELAVLLAESGFVEPHIRAFQLDRPPTTDQALNSQSSTPNPQPLAMELGLLAWPALRPLLAGRLGAAELARCDDLGADPQVELCTLALVAQARAG